MEFDGYHVTPTLNVKSIIDSYHNSTPIKTGMSYLQSQLGIGVISGQSKMKKPGSLGYGLYTFKEGLIDPEDLIVGFAKRITGDVQLKKVVFHIKVDEKNIIDLTNSSSTQYKDFVNYCRAAEKIISQVHHKFILNGKNQFVWDGIAMEMFIAQMYKSFQTKVDGVCRDTYTPLSDNSVNASERITSNGIEFMVRDWKIICTIKHSVLELD